MANPILLLLSLPALALLVTAAVLPRRVADRSATTLRRWVTGLATLQLGFAIAATLGHAWQMLAADGGSSALASVVASDFFPAASLYVDGVSSLMFLMVSFVGWVICHYSIRYLDGDRSQGNYFRWTGFTLGAVSLMVISGNLALFFACWLMTSLGLHRLLLHDPERPAARRAAWTKFWVVRIGDGAFAIALIMLYSELGTLQFSELFSAVGSIGAASTNLQAASFLLIAAAAIKSAQFPFHTWLPQTLETPTPVSALMHAGIVNAGGYLIVRASPIVSLAPWALTTLAVVGAITACFAALVMITQTSIKKSLAYSTIAQMGFMMLQCGLGAFSAALLHILAHSMYKAHAFLSSGGAIARQAPARTAVTAGGQPIATTLATTTFAAACLLASMWLLGIDPMVKPGGLLLGAVLCLALGHWFGQVYSAGHQTLSVRAAGTVAGLCLLYSSSFRIVDQFASASVPTLSMPLVAWMISGTIVVGGFAMLLVIERALSGGTSKLSGGRLYVHASNGFYVESVFRSVFGSLARS